MPSRSFGPARTRPSRFLGILATCLFAFAPACRARSAEGTSGRPASAEYNAESFAQELAHLKAELNSARKSPASLSGLRASLPKTWAVNDGTRRYVVSTETLNSLLFSAEIQSGNQPRQEQVDKARDYLDALATEATSLSSLPPQNLGPARAELKAILAQREFSSHRQPNLWEQIRARIYELLFRALDRILSRVGGAKSFGILLWIGICAAAVFIAYSIFRQWFRRSRMEEMALQAAASPARSWQEWVFASRDAASRGDYRTAVHCAYWAGIAYLQEFGAIPADRSKTPREYLRQYLQTFGRSAAVALHVPGARPVSDLSARRQALSTLTLLLEKFWYGGQTATDADFRDSLAHLEALGCHLL